MKVCIAGGEFSSRPELGGGHTFESQIFDTLRTSMTESHHEFVFFDKGNWRSPIQDIPPISTAPNSLSSQGSGNRTVSRPSYVSTALLNQLRKVRGRSSWIGRRYEQFKLNVLKRNNVDIVLALSPSVLTMEIPFITVVWDLAHCRYPYFPEVSESGEWEKREKFYSSALKRASFILTGTEAGKSDIAQFYQVLPQKIKVLPLPTPSFALDAPALDDDSVVRKYKIPENYLFYPAQFWPHKNHVGLLKAIRLLRDQYNLNLPIVFAGSDQGNQHHVEQVTRELGLEQQTFFLGFVSQTELISLYRKAFALTFLSFLGPDNLPPLEAMALGCPVIAADVVGAQEQLGDAALFVVPHKTEQVALAIKSLWTDENLRQTMIKRGLVKANEWVANDYIKGVFSILDEFENIRRCWSTELPF